MASEFILPAIPNLPRSIYTGEWTTGHIQGIAVDNEHKYIYCSFTTSLIKFDMQGNVIGSVKGLTGHLGCISFNPDDNKVYGSIEYKHDSIGQGIMKNTGVKIADEDAFYVAIFDVDKIDRPDMDAEKDGIMTAVYLPDVVDDFNATGEDGKPHRYACSGIDGTGFGPDFGAPADSEKYLFISYGIYGDTERNDNDNQIILKLDWRKFGPFAKPLTQGEPHHSGIRCEQKLFLYTGNTTWGVQNLEYDAFLHAWIVAVYLGKKAAFRNPPMFLIDADKAPVEKDIPGVPGEKAPFLTLKEIGVPDEANGLWGNYYPEGQTGVYAFGNGYYYYSYNKLRKDENGKKFHSSEIKLCRFTGKAPELFEVIE